MEGVGMSLIFIVVFISFLLIPLTYLTILFSLQHSKSHGDPHHGDDQPMNTHQIQLISVCNRLLKNTIFSRSESFCHDMNWNQTKMSSSKGLHGIKRYQQGNDIDDEDSKVECGVCLNVIEQGDEIRELKCNHLFHMDCLDSWVRNGRASCPMCRGEVRAPRMMVESTQGYGVSELLVFEFCSFSRRRHNRKDNWWIR